MESTSLACVAYASVGSGHRIAAKAVAVRLERRGLLRIPPVDALRHAFLPLSGELIAHVGTGRLAPLYDSLWFGERKAAQTGRYDALAGAVFRPLSRAFARSGVGVIACTHALPAIVAARARRQGDLDSRIMGIVTDFDVHNQWPLDLDAYCVPGKRAQQALLDRGVKSERVTVTGIPLRPGFDEPGVAHGPDGALPHVLIIAGALQQGLHRRVREALPRVLDRAREMDARVTIVTGTHGAFGPLVDLAADGRITLVAHTSEVARLMCTADVLVGKPGGLVCAEALSCRLPMVLVGPVFGQERANAEVLSTAGVALEGRDAEQVASLVADLLADDTRRGAMKEAASSLHVPGAAESVADIVADLAS